MAENPIITSWGGSCPTCHSTVICERTDGKIECLDCDFVWTRSHGNPPDTRSLGQ